MQYSENSRQKENQTFISRRLRPEARALGWTDLNTSQAEAFRRVLYMMDETLDALPVDLKGSPLIQQNRASTAAFISGRRGSGKSSVMLSLMRHGLGMEGDGITADKVGAAGSDRFEKAISSLQKSVVWLEPIDMDPLPAPFSLLPAILQRIEQAMDRELSKVHVGGHYSTSAPESLHRRSIEQIELYEELQHLYTDFTLAWESNIADRRGRLDPEYYASEVKQTNAARLSLNLRLSKFLERVSEQLYRKKRLLFVVTIDDFDLHPSSALRVLKLLRMLSAHRLFFLMLGDIELLELMSDLSVSGEVNHLISGHQHPETLSVEPSMIARETASIARTALRKLLPTGQRCFVDPPRIPEGMQYRPGSLNEFDNSQRPNPTLASLFANIPMPSQIWYKANEREECPLICGYRVPTLLHYLLHPGFTVFGSGNSGVWSVKDESDSQESIIGKKIIEESDLDSYFSKLHFPLGEHPTDRNRWVRGPRLYQRHDEGAPEKLRLQDEIGSVMLNSLTPTIAPHLELPSPETKSADVRKSKVAKVDLVFKQHFYWGLHVFETNPRQLADLWFALRQHVDRVTRLFDLDDEYYKEMKLQSGSVNAFSVLHSLEKSLHQILAKSCRDLLLEEPAFRPQLRSRIESALKPSLTGDFNWSELPVRLVSIPKQSIVIAGKGWARNRVCVPIENHPEGLPDTRNLYHEVRASEIEDWSMMAINGPKFSERGGADRSPRVSSDNLPVDMIDPNLEISPHAAALLMMFHDLLRLGSFGDRFVSNLMPSDDGTLRLVAPGDNDCNKLLENNVKDHIWCRWVGTRYKGSYKNYADLYWPPPTVLSTWGMDMFRRCWNTTVRYANQIDDLKKNQRPISKINRVELMAFGWISAGSAVTVNSLPVKPQIDDDFKIPRRDWAELWKQLNRLTEEFESLSNKPQSNQVDQYRTWLENVAVLLMPESGLPSHLMFKVLFGLPVDAVSDEHYKHDYSTVNRKECEHLGPELLLEVFLKVIRHVNELIEEEGSKPVEHNWEDRAKFESCYLLHIFADLLKIDKKPDCETTSWSESYCCTSIDEDRRKELRQPDPDSWDRTKNLFSRFADYMTSKLTTISHESRKKTESLFKHGVKHGGLEWIYLKEYEDARKALRDLLSNAWDGLYIKNPDPPKVNLRGDLPYRKIDMLDNYGCNGFRMVVGEWLRCFPYISFLEDYKTEIRARRGVRLALLASIVKGKLSERLVRSHCVQLADYNYHGELLKRHVEKEFKVGKTKKAAGIDLDNKASHLSAEEFVKSQFSLGCAFTGGGLLPHSDEIPVNPDDSQSGSAND